MWVQWQDIVEFGELLTRYPIEPANPITREWGFHEEQEYFAVTKLLIAPSPTGRPLVCDVHLANFYEPSIGCRTRFETDYPALAEFRRQIDLMMRKAAPTAVLEGFERPGSGAT